MPSADEAARGGALVVQRADLGTLVVTGQDRLEWLQAVLTCDVSDLPSGTGRWGLVLTKQGKILADVLVVAAPDAVYLGVMAAVLPRVHDWLSAFLIMEDAELSDASSRMTWMTLHGPRAAEVALVLARSVGGVAAPIDVTGLGGMALVLPSSSAGDVSASALSGGCLAQPGEWERLRVERLVPEYGVDMSDSMNPHEASLDRRAVSWSKGCYLGQEAVCMQDMRGKVKRRLSLLSLGNGALPASGTPVTDASGAVVGDTRTAVDSRVFQGPIALAVLAAGAAVPGTALIVDGAPAVVVEPSR